MTLFKADLLDGRAVAVVDGSAGLSERLESLGARLEQAVAADLDVEGAAEAWASSLVPLDALVCHVTGLDTLAAVWPVIRAVAAGALIGAEPAEDGATRKLILIGPPPEGEGVDSTEPARAAVGNLARTLSVEWARHQVVAAAIVPGAQTTADEVETLVAFLCSGAGHYYSGCTFSLGAVTDTR
jgi:hypothetical protein